MAKLGAVGKAAVLFFRFWMGEWYILSLIGLLALSVYLMWKREIPFFFHIKLTGLYLIVSSILLLSHDKLFRLLSNDGKFTNPSVISNTWELFMMEVRGETSTIDLGGGMVGAVLLPYSITFCSSWNEDYSYHFYLNRLYFDYWKVIWGCYCKNRTLYR